MWGWNFTETILFMTIEEVRKILWKKYESMTDEEVQHYIEYIKAICSFAVEDYIKEKNSKIEKDWS